jgi:ABC-type transporter Mla subunit MlaD
MNLLLAGLLLAALAMGWRLNARLKTLRDSHDSFATAVRELNAAAARAEQGLAELRAATDEAVEELVDRIAKGRVLAKRLEALIGRAPAPAAATPRAAAEDDAVQDIRSAERRLGALLAAARERRPDEIPFREPAASIPPRRLTVEDDLFDDDDGALALEPLRGGKR